MFKASMFIIYNFTFTHHNIMNKYIKKNCKTICCCCKNYKIVLLISPTTIMLPYGMNSFGITMYINKSRQSSTVVDYLAVISRSYDVGEITLAVSRKECCRLKI